MATIKKTSNNKCWREGRAVGEGWGGESLHTVMGM
jgi:hypothetical protein